MNTFLNNSCNFWCLMTILFFSVDILWHVCHISMHVCNVFFPLKISPLVSRGFNNGETERRGRKTGPSSAKAPAAKRQRTCGICHQPGHTRTTCPQGN